MRSARHGRHIMMFGCLCNIVLPRTDSTYLHGLPKDGLSVHDAFTVICGTIVLHRALLSPRTALHRAPLSLGHDPVLLQSYCTQAHSQRVTVLPSYTSFVLCSSRKCINVSAS